MIDWVKWLVVIGMTLACIPFAVFLVVNGMLQQRLSERLFHSRGCDCGCKTRKRDWVDDIIDGMRPHP